MKKTVLLVFAFLCLFPLFSGIEKKDSVMKLYIDEVCIPVSWENNSSTKALQEEVMKGDIHVSMSRYGGFEQVGRLGKSFPREDKEMNTQCGDIVLYSGNQIVVFFHHNSWAYTRLGKIELSTKEITALLDKASVSLRLTK